MSNSKIKDFMFSIDLYGLKPNIYIENYESFHSVTSLILTGITIIFSFIIIVTFGLSFLDDQTPIITVSEGTTNDPPSYDITSDNFAFLIGVISKDSQKVYDQSIFNIQIGLFIKHSWLEDNKLRFNVTYESFPTELCSKFDGKFQKIFSEVPIDKFYCSKKKNFTLHGTYFSTYHTHLLIKISQCQNSTSSPQICKPQEEIDRALSYAFFVFDYSDTNIDPTNYLHPINYYDGNKYLAISNNYFQNAVLYEKSVTIETDSGWLFESYNNFTFLQSEQVDIQTELGKTTEMLNFAFRLSNKSVLYKRRYRKLQDVAAQIGGIIKLVVIVFQTISKIFSYAKFYEFLTENLFNVFTLDKGMLPNRIKNINFRNINNSSFQKINKEDACFKDIDNINNVKNSQLNNISLKNIKSFSPGENCNKQQTSLKVDCLTTLLYIVPCFYLSITKSNKEILKIVKSNIISQMNIVNFFKKFNDIERMKKVFFDEDMMKLFNMNYKEDLIINDCNEVQENKNHYELINVYNKVKNNIPGKSKINRLLMALDSNFINNIK